MKKKISIEKLVFLCVITTSIVTVISLSKFETARDGSNDAKVAVYAVESYSEKSGIQDLKIDCTGEEEAASRASCSYVITNEVNGEITEVTVAYKVKVEFEDELPQGISIDVKDKEGRETNVTKINNSYIFENDEWEFTPGIVQTNTIVITFKGQNIENATSTTVSNVQVSVIAEQID